MINSFKRHFFQNYRKKLFVIVYSVDTVFLLRNFDCGSSKILIDIIGDEQILRIHILRDVMKHILVFENLMTCVICFSTGRKKIIQTNEKKGKWWTIRSGDDDYYYTRTYFHIIRFVIFEMLFHTKIVVNLLLFNNPIIMPFNGSQGRMKKCRAYLPCIEKILCAETFCDIIWNILLLKYTYPIYEKKNNNQNWKGKIRIDYWRKYYNID